MSKPLIITSDIPALNLSTDNFKETMNAAIEAAIDEGLMLNLLKSYPTALYQGTLRQDLPHTTSALHIDVRTNPLLLQLTNDTRKQNGHLIEYTLSKSIHDAYPQYHKWWRVCLTAILYIMDGISNKDKNPLSLLFPTPTLDN